MSLNRDIKVTIQNGGVGRLPIGEDYVTGLIMQSATLPSGFGSSDRIKIVYSIKGAEALGITAALFPVLHYQIDEYFRILEKYGKNGYLYVGIYAIGTGLFDGTEIQTMQTYAAGKLRQIGVFLIDPYASSFVTGANTYAQTCDTNGYPLSVYITAGVADVDSLVTLRTLDKKWVSVIIGMDGAGVGKTLYDTLNYSVCALGAILGITAVAEVQQRIGNMRIPYDLSGITELQTLMVADGTLLSAISDAQIDTLTDGGYTLIVKRRTAGSFVYVDAMTAALGTSDFIEQRFNRTISKAKRFLLDAYRVTQNSELYVNPDTGKMNASTISYLENLGLAALDQLAVMKNISFDEATGKVPRKSIQIDPNQNVLTTDEILVVAKVVPVGAVTEMTISLSLATSIS
jgi:hypothetical protein